jgi:dynein heavy chain
MFLSENQIPFKSLLYIIGEVNYGGRVTDAWDRRLLLCILKKFYGPDILDEICNFTSDGAYRIPLESEEGTPDLAYLKYIENLPLNDDVEIFGLHQNANATFQHKEAKEYLQTLLIFEPPKGSNPELGQQDAFIARLNEMVAELPKPLATILIQDFQDPMVMSNFTYI